MPFRPTNAPWFYSKIMKNFKDEWDQLLFSKVKQMEKYQKYSITVSSTYKIYIGNTRLTAGRKSIIDEILLWSNFPELVILYFKCVCMIFIKYQVSFKWSKCDFLKESVEYVGHNILKNGNSPASSKFDLINDWELPNTGQSLVSFIGLGKFYRLTTKCA